MFSFVFMQQNGLTITIKGGHDATALFRRYTWFTDIDHATESGKWARAHALSGCDCVVSGSAGAGFWHHPAYCTHFCVYSICRCKIHSETASAKSLKYKNLAILKIFKTTLQSLTTFLGINKNVRLQVSRFISLC